ncbi:hypothetical protein VPH35_010845 [Triticum aestivum]
MAPLQALSSALVLLLLAQHAHTVRASTLEDTCSLVGTGGAQDYDFCVKTLGADPASATADELGLAVIALRMAMVTAKDTGDRIARLQAAETSPRRRLALDECARITPGPCAGWGAPPRTSPRADEDRLTESEATTLLGDVRDTPARCDKAFVLWAGERSPLTDAGCELDDVMVLAFNILWHSLNHGAK